MFDTKYDSDLDYYFYYIVAICMENTNVLSGKYRLRQKLFYLTFSWIRSYGSNSKIKLISVENADELVRKNNSENVRDPFATNLFLSLSGVRR